MSHLILYKPRDPVSCQRRGSFGKIAYITQFLLTRSFLLWYCILRHLTRTCWPTWSRCCLLLRLFRADWLESVCLLPLFFSQTWWSCQSWNILYQSVACQNCRRQKTYHRSTNLFIAASSAHSWIRIYPSCGYRFDIQKTVPSDSWQRNK